MSTQQTSELVSMRALSAMADNILSCLKFTFDCPEQQQGSKGMPVLDTEIWVDKEERETGTPADMLQDRGLISMKTGKLRRVILYKFYRKPMAAEVPNLETSAAPNSQKIATVSQEILRRMKNTSLDLPPSVIEDVLRRYMDELKEGGYSKKWREQVLEASVTGFERILKGEKEGTGSLHRSDKSTRKIRRWKNLCGKSQWFQPAGTKSADQQTGKRGKKRKREGEGSQTEIESILYVPYTPDSELRKRLQKVEDSLLQGRLTGRIRIVERLGQNIKEILCNPTPWKQLHCGRPSCAPCRTKEGSCRAKNVTYTIQCMTCKAADRRFVYHGESSRTLYDRTCEHRDLLEKKSDESPLVKHWLLHHGDREDPPKFGFLLVGRHKSATERQLREALMIEDEDPSCLLNSKTEYGRNSVVRQTVEFDGRQYGGDSEQRETGRDRVIQKEDEVNNSVNQRTNRTGAQFSQSLGTAAPPGASSAPKRQCRQEPQGNQKRKKMKTCNSETGKDGFSDIRRWTRTTQK